MKVLESVLNAVRGRRGKREAVTVNNYADLVVKVADGHEVDPAQVDALMAQAGRSESQFRADVERVAARRELVDRARSLLKLRDERVAADLACLDAQQKLAERIQALRTEALELSGRAQELTRAEGEAEAALRVVLGTAPAELVAAFEQARAARQAGEEELAECERFSRGEFAYAAFAATPPRSERLQPAWRELVNASDTAAEVSRAHASSGRGIGQASGANGVSVDAVERAKAAAQQRRDALIEAAAGAAKKVKAELARLRAAEAKALEAVLAVEDAQAARLAVGRVR